MRIVACALPTIQRNPLLMAIALCLNFKNVTFILRKTCRGNAAVRDPRQDAYFVVSVLQALVPPCRVLHFVA